MGYGVLWLALAACGGRPASQEAADSTPAGVQNGMATDSQISSDRRRTDSLDALAGERLPVRIEGPLLVIYEYSGAEPHSPPKTLWTDGDRDRARAIAQAHGFEGVLRRQAPLQVIDVIHGRTVDVRGLETEPGVIIAMPGQPVTAASLTALRKCEWRCLTTALERMKTNRAAGAGARGRTA
jgi:hypothetical protein